MHFQRSRPTVFHCRDSTETRRATSCVNVRISHNRIAWKLLMAAGIYGFMYLCHYRQTTGRGLQPCRRRLARMPAIQLLIAPMHQMLTFGSDNDVLVWHVYKLRTSNWSRYSMILTVLLSAYCRTRRLSAWTIYSVGWVQFGKIFP